MSNLIPGPWEKARYSHLPPVHERVDFVLTHPDWWQPGSEKGYIDWDGKLRLNSGELVTGMMRYFRRYRVAPDDLLIFNGCRTLELSQGSDGCVTLEVDNSDSTVFTTLDTQQIEKAIEWLKQALEAAKK